MGSEPLLLTPAQRTALWQHLSGRLVSLRWLEEDAPGRLDEPIAELEELLELVRPHRAAA